MEVWAIIGSGLVGALGAFFGAYLKRKGEHYATKEDFDEVVRQLKATTAASSDVSERIRLHYGDQAVRRALLRDRLEKTMVASHEIEHWLEAQMDRIEQNQPPRLNCEPLDHAVVAINLYFPEHTWIAQQLQLSLGEEQMLMAKIRTKLGPLGQVPPEDRDLLLAEFEKARTETLGLLKRLRTELKTIAASDLHAP